MHHGDWKFTIYAPDSTPLSLPIHGCPTVMVFTSAEKSKKMLRLNEGCSLRPLGDRKEILAFLKEARDNGAKLLWIDPDYEISIAGKHQIPDVDEVIQDLATTA
jgi:hypothetical protein